MEPLMELRLIAAFTALGDVLRQQAVTADLTRPTYQLLCREPQPFSVLPLA